VAVTVEKLLVVLGTFTGIAYLVIGVVGGLWSSHWEDASASDQIIWIVLLLGGGLLLLAGIRISKRSPWAAAALISVGAVLGALPIFWTVLALLVAIALVVLSILYARGATGRSAPTPA
jgi:hypothetical protein